MSRATNHLEIMREAGSRCLTTWIYSGSMLGLFLDLEDEGDMFLRNVG
jgi:hypothetical protein